MALQNCVKVVLVGDKSCGKTSLSLSFTENACLYDKYDYVPTTFDHVEVTLNLFGNQGTMVVWDVATPATYEYPTLRSLDYPRTNVFLICFSSTSKASFDNVATKWCPEIRHHCPDIPFIVVAMKTDLVGSAAIDKEDLVDLEEAKKLAKELGGRYMECSSFTGKGVRGLFEEAFRSGLEQTTGMKIETFSSAEKKGCTIC